MTTKTDLKAHPGPALRMFELDAELEDAVSVVGVLPAYDDEAMARAEMATHDDVAVIEDSPYGEDPPPSMLWDTYRWRWLNPETGRAELARTSVARHRPRRVEPPTLRRIGPPPRPTNLNVLAGKRAK